MRSQQSVLAILIFMSALLSFPEAEALSSTQGSSMNDGSEDTVLKYLRTTLSRERDVGRLYFGSNSCSLQSNDPIEFPQINPQASSDVRPGLSGIRDLFRRDKKVEVTREVQGVIK